MNKLFVVFALIGLVAGRQINQAGINLIKEMEGFRGNFYYDQIGIKTIGYGHACPYHNNCNDIHPPISEAQGTQIMLNDLTMFDNCVQSAAPGLNDNQFAACVDFAFNMGCGAFQGSTVLQNIRARNWQGAAQAFNNYVSAGGRVIAGLVNRRKREQQLFLS